MSNRTGAPAPARHTFDIALEPLLALTSLFWAFSANQLFLRGALQGRSFADWQTWGFALALLVMLTASHYLLLALLTLAMPRPLLRPLLALLIVATAAAAHFMQTFGVYLDPTMLRNALHTNVAEARELLSWSLLAHMLVYAALPLALLWHVRVLRRAGLRAVGLRLLSAALALALLLGTLMLVFQPFASLMRNHRELRYQATPANYVWSLGAVAAAQARGAARPRQAIGLDAQPGPRTAALGRGQRPLVVVLVVGETARAANWGLNGYARQTTPELARVPGLISFTQVDSCGTNTEVSLPCMFAPVGRRDYDEARIRGSESLLHVLARAGVAVQWRDNQSGCKGVCEGLPYEEVASLNPAGLCSAGHCLDEGLLLGLDERLTRAAGQQGSQLLVLHQLGNHGPAYFRRYPPAFAQFKPVCEYDDLQRCSQAEIVNAYDNALLYTDHLLAGIVHKLQAAAANVDSLLLYVSDHGESLGENNLWLHGMPYPIAPDVQKRVPMLMWLSAGAPQALALDAGCLQRRAAQPASHDHLFHTLLGVFDVRTALHEPAWDLGAGCRAPVPGP